MADATSVILHHYDTSPFSEKIRLIFGLKGLSWASVKIPNMMPKPDLMPLTGGYRKTPVVQVGADIYCDTAMIARMLEERAPSPSLFPCGNRGLAWSVSRWADSPVFMASVGIIFGTIGEHVPEAFIKDRQAFAGGRFDMEAMKQAVPMMKDHWRSAMGWTQDQLGGGQPFLFGDAPGLADISCYMNVWFLRGAVPPAADALLREFPRVTAWAERVAALGHGSAEEIDGDSALAIAAAAEPATRPQEDPHDPNGLKPGMAVTVTPDDTGRVPVAGTLVSSSAQHIAIERTDPKVGRVVLHFPRAGFAVLPA